MTQAEVYERVGRLMAQYEATRYALAQAVTAPLAGVTPKAFTTRHLRDGLHDLEAMYIVRLFALFEGVLVSFARARRLTLRKGRLTMASVMRRVAARLKLPTDVLDGADRVRRSRNGIVHHDASPAIPLEDSKSFLNRFVSHLPRAW